ncbi:hypothetical protein EPO04_02460 [Patescibacteria group bacterium]|nr:MAG: hypothetical protein EPO04_02460 [Patescibacteria group bacterium]
MSKKKSRSKKKRVIRTSQQSVAAKPNLAANTAVASAKAPATAKATKSDSAGAGAAVVTDEWGYVRRDVRQITLLAVGCIGTELLLWWLLSSTSLGDQVYNLIQL